MRLDTESAFLFKCHDSYLMHSWGLPWKLQEIAGALEAAISGGEELLAAKKTGDGPQLQLNPSQALVACLQRCSLPQSLMISSVTSSFCTACHLLSMVALCVNYPSPSHADSCRFSVF